MSSIREKRDKGHLERAALYALQVLSLNEICDFENHCPRSRNVCGKLSLFAQRSVPLHRGRQTC